MTQLDRIEVLFFEARRSAFMISFLCFIGTAISLVGLAMLDPALGMVIPALAVVVLALFMLMFLLLSFRLFQPISEIIKMVNKLYTDIMVDELELEPVGAGAETERQQLEEVTQRVEELTKEISVLKKEHPPSAKEQDTFWRDLTLKYAVFGAILCVAVFIAPNPLDLILAVAGAVGLTAIALIHAHYEGRLKWLGDRA